MGCLHGIVTACMKGVELKGLGPCMRYLHEDIVDAEGLAQCNVVLRLFEREALAVPAQQALHEGPLGHRLV